MADPRFKVKRQAYFKRGITTASTLNVTKGIVAACGLTVATGIVASSTMTLAGGFTAARVATTTGCLVVSTGGTPIAGLLAGSAAVTIGNIATSVASITCFPVTGLTTAHKVFINSACISGSLIATCAFCSPAGASLMVGFVNYSSETLVGGASTLHYLAILDK